MDVNAEITKIIREAIVEAARMGIGKAILIVHQYAAVFPHAKADCDRLEALLRAESVLHAEMGEQ